MGVCSCVLQLAVHACALSVAVYSATDEKKSIVFHPVVLSVFVLVSLLLGADLCHDETAHLTRGAKRRHELLVARDGMCGCVPSRGRLLRVRRVFFNGAAVCLLPMVVASRFLPVTHVGACAAFFSATVFVSCHAPAGATRACYTAFACTIAGVWLVGAAQRAAHVALG